MNYPFLKKRDNDDFDEEILQKRGYMRDDPPLCRFFDLAIAATIFIGLILFAYGFHAWRQ